MIPPYGWLIGGWLAWSFVRGFLNARAADYAAERELRLDDLRKIDERMRATDAAIVDLDHDRHGRVKRAKWRAADGTFATAEWI